MEFFQKRIIQNVVEITIKMKTICPKMIKIIYFSFKTEANYKKAYFLKNAFHHFLLNNLKISKK